MRRLVREIVHDLCRKQFNLGILPFDVFAAITLDVTNFAQKTPVLLWRGDLCVILDQEPSYGSDQEIYSWALDHSTESIAGVLMKSVEFLPPGRRIFGLNSSQNCPHITLLGRAGAAWQST